MNGMGPATTVIDKLPEFNGAPWRVGEDTIVDIVEGYTIDLPCAVPLEVLVGDDPKCRRLRNSTVTYFCSKLNT